MMVNIPGLEDGKWHGTPFEEILSVFEEVEEEIIAMGQLA